jgi:DMSO/TMAO reductase YedYZ molybdopterin-dependent catalytic subunit
MNGAPLTPAHGFPLRVVVPGWFGMASVKWLQRIVVTREPFNGYYQSIDYTYWEERDGMPTLVPLAEMRVKAQIARPHMDELVSAGQEYRVHGAAWGGEHDVVKVEVSEDSGASWLPATLLDEPVKNAWRFWEFRWKTPPQPGDYTLMARATDAAGQTQPPARVAEYGTYMINHVLPIRVHVK